MFYEIRNRLMIDDPGFKLGTFKICLCSPRRTDPLWFPSNVLRIG